MALHRYGDFRVEVFYFDSPCIVTNNSRKSETDGLTAVLQTWRLPLVPLKQVPYYHYHYFFFSFTSIIIIVITMHI